MIMWPALLPPCYRTTGPSGPRVVDAACALITPLGAEHDGRRHDASVYGTGTHPSDRRTSAVHRLGIVLTGAIVGFTVGTGMGGGALMTPILVIFFG
jgi:hypothetical protein